MNYILVIRDLVAVVNPGPQQYFGWKVIGELASAQDCEEAAAQMNLQRHEWCALRKGL